MLPFTPEVASYSLKCRMIAASNTACKVITIGKITPHNVASKALIKTVSFSRSEQLFPTRWGQHLINPLYQSVDLHMLASTWWIAGSLVRIRPNCNPRKTLLTIKPHLNVENIAPNRLEYLPGSVVLECLINAWCPLFFILVSQEIFVLGTSAKPLVTMSSLMKFLIVLFVSCAYAAKPLGHEVCVASCYYSLLKAKYAGASSKAQTACTNKLRVQSTYYCMKLHCEEEDIEPGVAWWAGTCANSTKVVNVEAYKSTTASTTESYLSNLPTVKQKEKNIFNGTAVPSKDNWEIVYRSVYTYSEMRDYHNAVR